MSGPDRIFAKSWRHATHTEVGVWSATHHVGTVEYIRRAPAVLAALPDVQALIAGAFEAARLAAFHALHGCPVYTSPLIATTTAIRALTHADALAARDAMLTAEREACLVIISEYAENDILKPASGWPDEEVRAWNTGGLDHLLAVADAIRKRGEGQP